MLACLDSGAADPDTLVAASSLPPPLALARIGDLLAAGTIVSGPDGRLRRTTA
jgi:hypothetical protein